MSRVLLLSIALLISQPSIAAGKEQALHEAYDNVANEYISCGAYFTILSNALKRSKNTESAMKMDLAMEHSMNFAMLAMERDRTIEDARKITEDKFLVELEKQRKSIDYNYDNIATLVASYRSDCATAMQSPEAVISKWLGTVVTQ